MDKVIFRKFPNGDIIALFPGMPADNKGNITSYMIIGQHSGADPELINELDIAYPGEWRYQELKKELELIGYELNIVKEK